MRNDRHLAIKLRKQGESYKKISEALDVPKSTLNYWFKDLAWSNSLKDKLTERARRASEKRIKKLVKFNQARWTKYREEHRDEATKAFTKLKNSRLFIAGLMLYWGEGDQNLKYPVRLANVNYKMVALFNKFLLEICKIKREDIHLSLFIYPDIEESKCKKYWSEKTKVKFEQFDKAQVIYGKHPTKRLENGICAIGVKRSTGLKEKIMVWINLLSENLFNS